MLVLASVREPEGRRWGLGPFPVGVGGQASFTANGASASGAEAQGSSGVGGPAPDGLVGGGGGPPEGRKGGEIV